MPRFETKERYGWSDQAVQDLEDWEISFVQQCSTNKNLIWTI